MRDRVLLSAAGARLLEIGGPSRIFGPRGLLPVYGIADQVDNVNFASRTAWEQGLNDGGAFRPTPDRPAGTQWLREAVSLTGLPAGTYDLVLSSHCLEHVANPLAALREWRRVAHDRSYLLLVLPDPARTFDHRRPVTSLAHLRTDAERGTPEDDSTHFAEVLAAHDLSRDPDAGTPEEFRARTERNAEHRCVHHHVFNLDLIGAMLPETGWWPLALERARPCHLVAFAQAKST